MRVAMVFESVSISNAICADCHAPDPQWASTNLGVLVCVECAGCHRALGPHISQVRSLTLDSWDPTMRMLLSTLQSSAIAIQDGATGPCARCFGPNSVWEAALPPDEPRPPQSGQLTLLDDQRGRRLSSGSADAASREAREHFVRCAERERAPPPPVARLACGASTHVTLDAPRQAQVRRSALPRGARSPLLPGGARRAALGRVHG